MATTKSALGPGAFAVACLVLTLAVFDVGLGVVLAVEPEWWQIPPKGNTFAALAVMMVSVSVAALAAVTLRDASGLGYVFPAFASIVLTAASAAMFSSALYAVGVLMLVFAAEASCVGWGLRTSRLVPGRAQGMPPRAGKGPAAPKGKHARL